MANKRSTQCYIRARLPFPPRSTSSKAEIIATDLTCVYSGFVRFMLLLSTLPEKQRVSHSLLATQPRAFFHGFIYVHMHRHNVLGMPSKCYRGRLELLRKFHGPPH